MKAGVDMLRRIGFVLFLVLCCSAVFGAANSKTPGTAFIEIEKKYSQINDYKADVTMTIKGPQISINRMPMTVYYKKPDKFTINAKQGMAIAPFGMFNESPGSQFTKGPKPTYLRTEKYKGVNCWAYKVSDKDHPGGDVYIWVDFVRMVVVAVELKGTLNLKSEWDYIKVGNFYMPSKIYTSMPLPVVQRGPNKNAAPATQGTANTVVDVTIKNYKINKGISDSVFVEKKKKK